MKTSILTIVMMLSLFTIGSLSLPASAQAVGWELEAHTHTPDCEHTPEPSPIPTPIPTPTPSDPPSTGGPHYVDHTILGLEHLNCEDDEFVAAVELSTNGVRRNNIKVVFRFDGITKEATTNDEGTAKVTFPRGHNGTLTAEPQGFPFQSQYVEAPSDCRSGQVLGATTLADTGSHDQTMFVGLGVIGVLACSAALYGYFKRN